MNLIRRQYEENYHDNPLYRETLNSQRNHTRLNLIQAQKPAGFLLEIGCGEGGFLSLAAPLYEVEGFDLSRAAIEKLKTQFGERVQVLNIEQRPIPKSRYDIVVAFNILEHLQRPEKAIDKIYQALLPGGVLVGSVPNKQRIVGGIVTRVGNFFDRTHVSTLTPDTWQRMFSAAGFKQIEFFGEVTLGRNRCRYLTGKAWPHLAFNLMFVCKK